MIALIFAALIIINLSLVEPIALPFNLTSNGFPKVVWSYWEQGLDNAPFFTKLCVKNSKKIAQKSGWTHIILSGQTVHQYIDPQEIEKYLSISLTRHIQLKADLIRLLLILKYGGLWIDINSYFLKDLSWVENYNHSYIKNRLGDSPDIILAAYTEGISKAIYRIHESGQTINMFPIYENWMILGKPYNQFLQDCLKIYVQTHQKTKEVMDAENIQNNIILPNPIQNYYFIGSDYIEQIAIQRKQRELQQQNSSLYAVQYYHLWHVEAHEGAFKMFLDYNQYVLAMWADLSTYSTAQIQQEVEIPFFRKYLGWHHRFFSNYLNNYASYNCWGLQLLVEEKSEISEVLFANAQYQPFMRDIKEFEQNKASIDYCKALQMNNQTEGSYLVILTVQWIIFFIVALIVWCCYLSGSPFQKKEKWNPANVS